LIRLPPLGATRPAHAVRILPRRCADISLEHVESNLNAGKPQVAQIIEAINVFNIKVVVVAPAYWPSLIVPKRIAAILEAVIPAAHLGAPHVEGVSMTEMGVVTDVRYAAIVTATAATVVSNGLLRLRGALRLCLRLRGALWLCLRLRGALRLRLRLLGPLWLRLRGALWLCLRLRGTLRLLLLLRWLGALRLRLFLRLRCFPSASALFLFALLRECRNSGCEK